MQPIYHVTQHIHMTDCIFTIMQSHTCAQIRRFALSRNIHQLATHPTSLANASLLNIEFSKLVLPHLYIAHSYRCTEAHALINGLTETQKKGQQQMPIGIYSKGNSILIRQHKTHP